MNIFKLERFNQYMLKMKIFWQKDCPKCPEAKEIGSLFEKEIEVIYYDVDTVDGLSEACMYQVTITPSIVIVNEKGEEIESWKETLPEIDYIREKISDR